MESEVKKRWDFVPLKQYSVVGKFIEQEEQIVVKSSLNERKLSAWNHTSSMKNADVSFKEKTSLCAWFDPLEKANYALVRVDKVYNGHGGGGNNE